MNATRTIRRSAATVLAVLGLTLGGCGGGGGGGGNDGGGPAGPTTAELQACQAAIQSAGATALEVRMDGVASCGAAVMACRIRTDVDGAPSDPCLADAAGACNAALGALPATSTTMANALSGSACSTLGITDLTGSLAFGTLASRCDEVGGGTSDTQALAACLGAAVECAAVGALAASAPVAPGILATRGVALTSASCGATATSAPVRLNIAQAFVVNGELGSVFDGLVDGFPGIAPHDGTADVAGNQLGVGLKHGSTEERGVGEFPLATLVGSLTAGEITSAVLTFNVDDVLSTFGPGTDFDGTASERIQIFTYAGDGAVTLADFANGEGTPAAVVTTGPQGTITDATLASSGPVVFEVDLTAEVRALVQSGATHLGVVFATDDDHSGTSIDNLGPNSAGPPGVGGARLPFLTINGGGEPDPVCGDGNVDDGEACDDRNTTPGDGCDADCQKESAPVLCGNGSVDEGEECDLGAGNSDTAPNTCRTNCRNPRCGDTVVDAGEGCDGGGRNSDTAKDACRTTCEPARCGDGVVDTHEQCDPPGGACTESCTAIVVDAGAQFIACQHALLTMGAQVTAASGDAVGACLAAQVGCALAPGDQSSCYADADGTCDAAASALESGRQSFVVGFPAACVGRSPAELVVALGLNDRTGACAASGAPVTTLEDVADCLFGATACPVTRAFGELAPAGTRVLAERGATPAGLACLGAP